jgi:hypothetical protein
MIPQFMLCNQSIYLKIKTVDCRYANISFAEFNENSIYYL